VKNYPFEVRIINNKINGVVLSDQIKSFDWRTRDIEFIAKATVCNMDEIINKMSTLILR